MARALRLEVTIGRYIRPGSTTVDLNAEVSLHLVPLRDRRMEQERDQSKDHATPDRST